MKKYFLIFVSMFCLNMVFGQQNVEDIIEQSKELGLVSYLTTVKVITESKMIILASSDTYEKQIDGTGELILSYYLLKLEVDKLINQLVADMIDKNSLKNYRKINAFLKNGKRSDLPTSLLPFKTIIKNIDTFLVNRGAEKITAGEVVGIIEIVHGIIKDARDFRAKKIADMATLLNDLKLEHIKDLIKEND